jgi:hypothetical protein
VKNTVMVITASLLTVGLATGVSAQTPRPSTDTKRDSTAGRDNAAQRPAWSPEAGHVDSSKIIGMRVRTTADNKDAGEIDAVIVNPSDGKITHVVMGQGGLLGIGETKLALAWSDLKIQRDPDNADKWVALVDRAKLDAAPRYQARKDRDTAPAASPASPPASRPAEPAKKY